MKTTAYTVQFTSFVALTPNSIRALVSGGTQTYGVELTPQACFCSCPHHLYRGRVCKHMHATVAAARQAFEAALDARDHEKIAAARELSSRAGAALDIALRREQSKQAA